MADKNDGGDKTEKPTPRRLRDARRKGEVAKSKDVTSVAALFAWVLLGALLTPFLMQSLIAPLDVAFSGLADPGGAAMRAAVWRAARTFVTASLVLLAPVAVVGTLAEFLQAGPVATTERMKFKLDHLNPGEGLKRMFSVDNLFEVGKSVLKTAVLILITALVVCGAFGALTGLPRGTAAAALAAMGQLGFQLLAASAGVFVFVAVLDAAYQRFAFTKRLRMSRRDIRQESKDDEGDPHIRAQRRQLHQEWSNRNAAEAARGASVLVVNPTHLAVALVYDPKDHPAPVVSAKGEGPLAAAMRREAEASQVPVAQNVSLARALHARTELEEVVPEDLFAAVAEVILWAQRLREETA